MRWAVAAALAAAAPLAPPAAAQSPGEALFTAGADARVEIAGGVTLPAARFSCAGCHGADGEGRREGGTVFPPIRWDALTSARRMPAYDADSFARAILEGVDPAGRTLSRAMPRYRVEPDALVSLIAYLGGMGDSASAGIAPGELRFAATGDAGFDAGFAAFAQGFNDAGGVFGRRVSMATGATTIDTAALVAGLDDRLEAGCRAALLQAMRADGVDGMQIAGKAGPDAAYRAEAAGLRPVPEALAVLFLPGADPRGFAGRRIYGCMDVLGPAARDLTRNGNRLTIAVPDAAAVRWALASGTGARGVAGHVFARLVTDAALSAGRGITVPRLAEELSRQRVGFRILHLPGPDDAP